MENYTLERIHVCACACWWTGVHIHSKSSMAGNSYGKLNCGQTICFRFFCTFIDASEMVYNVLRWPEKGDILNKSPPTTQMEHQASSKSHPNRCRYPKITIWQRSNDWKRRWAKRKRCGAFRCSDLEPLFFTRLAPTRSCENEKKSRKSPVQLCLLLNLNKFCNLNEKNEMNSKYDNKRELLDFIDWRIISSFPFSAVFFFCSFVCRVGLWMRFLWIWCEFSFAEI